MSIKLIKKIFAWVERTWWAKTIVLPAVIIIPTTLVAACEQYPELKSWLAIHYKTKFVFVFWSVLLIPAAVVYDRFQPRTPANIQQLSYLIEVLNGIVGAKTARFVSRLKKLSSPRNKKDAKGVFKDITQPQKQIEQIVIGVWQFFESTKAKTVDQLKLRVVLARMGSEHIEAFEFHHPPDQPIRSAIEKLQNHQSGFSCAKRERQLIVVEDFQKEREKDSGSRFVLTRDEAKTENGSMMCFPVVDPIDDNVKYVLSICTKEPGYFRNDDHDLYQDILEHFGKRLVLEYCLKQIKSKCV